jgi:acyl-CoA reductase-like NAD-dependent aldehyde dehydrogenase
MNPAELDQALQTLETQKHRWAVTPVRERLGYLMMVRAGIMAVAADWANTAARKKGIDPDSPAAAEEWLGGPYALMAYCNAMLQTLNKVAGHEYLNKVPLRDLPNGQLAAQILPAGKYDKILQPGVTAEVWMQPGITRDNLKAHAATTYAKPLPNGRVSLVLGAGNVASIAPIDCLHKLLVDNSVVILKMNPVNDYISGFLETALAPFVKKGYLRIVKGGADVGDYLCTHPLVHDIHITGSQAVHDMIIWGTGPEQAANKAANRPKNKRPITSELGGVSPTIVVPGPWSSEDLTYQAEHIASQKLNNAGANCIATQVLVMEKDWSLRADLITRLKKTIADNADRPAYYPGSKARLEHILAGEAVPETTRATVVKSFDAGSGGALEAEEAFGPALGVTTLTAGSPEAFLIAAIDYANTQLPGTLGANILIHPQTLSEIGRARFETLIAGLRYGTIAINTWSGGAFAMPAARWGAFPGHALNDVQSGIGWVHNALLFEAAERTVLEAPFHPKRRPLWFITNRKALGVARRLLDLQFKPGFRALLKVLAAA